MSRFIALVKSLRPYRLEHWLMLILLMYSFVGILKYYLPMPLVNAIYTFCGFGFLCLILFNIRRSSLSGFTGFFYALLVIWTFCLTLRMFFLDNVRGTFTEYHGITTWLLAFFFSPYFLPNMMPLVLLVLPRKGFDFRYLWNIMWFMAIFYLCYFPFAFWSMTHYSWSFDVAGATWGDEGTYGDFISNSTKGIASIAPVVIMLFLKKYIQKSRWLWFFVAYLGSVLIQIFLARRGGLAVSLLYLVLLWLVYTFNDKNTSKWKMIIMIVLIVGIFLLMFSSTSSLPFFSTLFERGFEDSRSAVEGSFYKDMDSAVDWIFGRGWFGQYYDPVFGKSRSSIETGYLALILRGGLLYLIPYVSVLALSFYNGYFKSNNIFCKSFSIICLVQIINLYPYGWPAFNFLYFILWLGVWICNNRQLRCMRDDQIFKFCF